MIGKESIVARSCRRHLPGGPHVRASKGGADCWREQMAAVAVVWKTGIAVQDSTVAAVVAILITGSSGSSNLKGNSS
jgi:hypothetical protein